MRLFLPVFWLFFGLMAPVFAQNQLTGTVRDAQNGQPVAGAAVVARGLSLGAHTDSVGGFSLNLGQHSGAITLTITAIGYQKAEAAAEAGQTLVISLQSEALRTDDVVITAARGLEQHPEDLTVSVQVVKQRAIDLQGTADITRSLTQMPGVDVLDGQVNIRGSSGYAYGTGSRVMVMLNGLPLLSGDAAAAPLSFLPTDNIQRIEVVKGASSVLYGSSAMGGVINVITGEPDEKWHGSLRARGTLFGTPANPALNWDGKKMSPGGSVHGFAARTFRLGESRLIASGHADYTYNTGYRYQNGQKNLRLYGTLGWRYKNWTAAVNVSHQSDSNTAFLYWNTYYPGTKPSLFSTDTIYTQGALTPALGSGITRHQLTQRTAIDPSLRYLSRRGDLFWYRGRAIFSQNSNNTGQGSRVALLYNDFVYQRTFWNKLSLSAGATHIASTVQADSLYGGAHSSSQLAGYLQLDYKLGRLSLNAGGRFEHIQQDTLEPLRAPVFRGGANLALWKGANVRASAGQSYRMPSVAERFTATTGGQVLVMPNPHLQPESGYSLEAGLRQGFRTKSSGKLKLQGYADVALFYQRYKNMIEFGIQRAININDLISNSFPFTSRNVVDASILGSEVIVEGGFMYGKWHGGLSAGVTYLNPRNLNPAPDSQLLYLYDYDRKVDSVIAGDLSAAKFFLDKNGIPARLADTSLKDAPAVLKYRSRWMGRVSANIGYERFTLTANLRMQSQMLAIDQFLYMVVRDWYAFEQTHRGYAVLDLVAQYRFTERLSASLHLDNATNTEYAIIPGYLAEQRRGTLQVVYRW